MNGVSGSLTATTSIFLAVSVGNCTPTPITPLPQAGKRRHMAGSNHGDRRSRIDGELRPAASRRNVVLDWSRRVHFEPARDRWNPIERRLQYFCEHIYQSELLQQYSELRHHRGVGSRLHSHAVCLPLFRSRQGKRTASDTITVTGSGGFNSSVTLSATGLPRRRDSILQARTPPRATA